MAFKPSSRSIKTYKTYEIIDHQAEIKVPIQDTKRDLKTSQERKEDSIERMKIHALIKRLKDGGYTESEALEELYSVFPDSEYRGFFKGWVSNLFKSKTNRDRFPTNWYSDER